MANYNASTTTATTDFPEYSVFALRHIVGSAIAMDVAAANMDEIPAAKAIREMIEDRTGDIQRDNTSFVKQGTKKIRDAYNCWYEGSVIRYSSASIDEYAGTPAFCPENPRMVEAHDRNKPKGFGPVKLKPAKYELPLGAAAEPLIPFVPMERQVAIFARYGLTRDFTKPFWHDVAANKKIPLYIEEGMKKALCLISHDLCAIALRSATTWAKKKAPGVDVRVLHDSIQYLVGEGRKVTIDFDQDSKPETILAIGIEKSLFARELANRGAVVSIGSWDGLEGKGIDDVIFAAVDRPARVERLIADAIPFPEWDKAGRRDSNFSALRNKGRFPAGVEVRESIGRYMSALTIDKRITFISAPTGSGKSTVMREAIRAEQGAGALIILLTPTNTVGQQGAELLGLPHRHDHITIRMWLGEITAEGGAALCYNSIVHLETLISDAIASGRRIVTVMDEVNQGLAEVVAGETMADRYESVTAILANLLQHSAVIIAAEAKVKAASIELVRQLAGENDYSNIAVVDHRVKGDRGSVKISSKGGLSGLFKEALAASEDGPIAWATDSVANAKLVEAMFSSMGKTVERYDAQTIGQHRGITIAPMVYIKKKNADVTIYTPVLKTGISIDGDHFVGVFAYFSHLPPSGCLQMLTRVRANIPRSVYIPACMPSRSGLSLSERAIQENQDLTIKLIGKDSGLVPLPLSLEEQKICNAIDAFYREEITSSGLEKSFAREYLAHLCQEEGFEVEQIERAGDTDISKTLKEMKITLEIRDSEALAAETPAETIEEANRILRSGSATEAQRRAAYKRLWIEKHPELDLDDPTVCRWGFVARRGTHTRGIAALVDSEFADVALAETMAEISNALFSGHRHRTPTRAIKGRILHLLKIGKIIADRDRIFTNTDADLVSLQATLVSNAAIVRAALGIGTVEAYRDTAGRSQNSPVEVLGKVIRSFGLCLMPVAHRGSDGRRVREYKVVPIVTGGLSKADRLTAIDEAFFVRDQMLTSARAKAREAQNKLAAIEVEDAPPKQEPWSPIVGAMAGVRLGDKLIKGLIELVQDAGAGIEWVLRTANGLITVSDDELLPA